jgi:hypothetical protein
VDEDRAGLPPPADGLPHPLGDVDSLSALERAAIGEGRFFRP